MKLLFRGVWRPRSNTTHEFLMWLLKLFTLLLVIRGYCFSALISHEIMYFKNNQNVGNLLLFVVSHVVVKMAEVFGSKYRKPFSFSKNWGRRIKVAAREHS